MANTYNFEFDKSRFLQSLGEYMDDENFYMIYGDDFVVDRKVFFDGLRDKLKHPRVDKTIGNVVSSLESYYSKEKINKMSKYVLANNKSILSKRRKYSVQKKFALYSGDKPNILILEGKGMIENSMIKNLMIYDYPEREIDHDFIKITFSDVENMNDYISDMFIDNKVKSFNLVEYEE